MKPDWNHAPDWANYFAIDPDGNAYWFEDRPVSGQFEWLVNDGRMMRYFPCRREWASTLEERPQ